MDIIPPDKRIILQKALLSPLTYFLGKDGVHLKSTKRSYFYTYSPLLPKISETLLEKMTKKGLGYYSNTVQHIDASLLKSKNDKFFKNPCLALGEKTDNTDLFYYTQGKGNRSKVVLSELRIIETVHTLQAQGRIRRIYSFFRPLKSPIKQKILEFILYQEKYHEILRLFLPLLEVFLYTQNITIKAFVSEQGNIQELVKLYIEKMSSKYAPETEDGYVLMFHPFYDEDAFLELLSTVNPKEKILSIHLL